MGLLDFVFNTTALDGFYNTTALNPVFDLGKGWEDYHADRDAKKEWFKSNYASDFRNCLKKEGEELTGREWESPDESYNLTDEGQKEVATAAYLDLSRQLSNAGKWEDWRKLGEVRGLCGLTTRSEYFGNGLAYMEPKQRDQGNGKPSGNGPGRELSPQQRAALQQAALQQMANYQAGQ